MVWDSPLSLTSHILQADHRQLETQVQTELQGKPSGLALVEGKGTSNDPREYGNPLFLFLFVMFYFFTFSHISVPKEPSGDLKEAHGKGKNLSAGETFHPDPDSFDSLRVRGIPVALFFSLSSCCMVLHEIFCRSEQQSGINEVLKGESLGNWYQGNSGKGETQKSVLVSIYKHLG